jgi:hypothetical protein
MFWYLFLFIWCGIGNAHYYRRIVGNGAKLNKDFPTTVWLGTCLSILGPLFPLLMPGRK